MEGYRFLEIPAHPPLNCARCCALVNDGVQHVAGDLNKGGIRDWDWRVGRTSESLTAIDCPAAGEKWVRWQKGLCLHGTIHEEKRVGIRIPHS